MTKNSSPQNNSILVKMMRFFFVQWRFTTLVWLTLLLTGAFIYTQGIKREGFPPVSFPITFVSGQYPNQPKTAVDSDIVLPLSRELSQQDGISSVESRANDGFYSIVINFDGDTTSEAGTAQVQRIIDEAQLPENSFTTAVAVDPGSFLFRYDLVAQVYSTSGASEQELESAASYAATELKQLDIIEEATLQPNFVTQGTEQLQTSFSRVALSSEESANVDYYQAATIGVKIRSGEDILALSDQVDEQLEQLDFSSYGEGIQPIVSADFASQIRANISFLESNMVTGLIAVAFMSFLLITWRASLITGLFMITVMLLTIIILWLIGYTLNVITLFALILSLGLFVDDATIAVEAIDVNSRDKRMNNLAVASHAVKKVGLASLAGTLTTVLVFAILATPSGILGEFIRLIPITVIIALLSSFILSMTLIPFLARFLMLRTRESSWITRHNPVLKLEEYLGGLLERLVLATRSRGGKVFAMIAISISIISFFAGVYIFAFKVDNNIFPPAKDSDRMAATITFNGVSTIEQAEDVTSEIDTIIAKTIGDQIVFGSYIGERLPNVQQASVMYDLVPFTERDVTAAELAQRANDAIRSEFNGPAVVSLRAVDSGPPASQFPFALRVYSDDESVLDSATEAFGAEFKGSNLTDFKGDVVRVTGSRIEGVGDSVFRDNARRYAKTQLAYDSQNSTTVSTLTEAAFKERFDDSRLAALGVSLDNIEFDAGQEGDFQNSFNTLLIAVPISLALMYILLAIQFRSLTQPFLILLAIPFTVFGVALGLLMTDNSASFFALVGFIGLIGIAVNNTIMLTDYANQERKDGKSSVEAIATAARKRLRPLLTTTVTTIVALLPLAVSDPFWESLAFTIIFGLLSSTIFVLLSYPYYYLSLEWLRRKLKLKRA